MEAEAFCYWLQGFFELQHPFQLSNKQVTIIKDHLDLVFQKVTPDRSKTVNEIDIQSMKYPAKMPSMIYDENQFPNLCNDQTKYCGTTQDLKSDILKLDKQKFAETYKDFKKKKLKCSKRVKISMDNLGTRRVC